MGSSKIINRVITIQAPISKVWAMLTTPILMKLWMSQTELEIISDFKVGSPIYIHSKMNGIDNIGKGMILKYEPEKVFQYNLWNEISKVPDKPENYTNIEFILSSNKTQTKLEFSQNNFVGEASYEHNQFFWNVALEIMKRKLEEGGGESKF